jgi:ankyrin repeat protein
MHSQCSSGGFAIAGALSAVDALLAAGAEVGAACERGATALHHAAEAGRAEVLRRLLEASDASLVRRPDAAGWAPLHYAARHAAPECASLLLQVWTSYLCSPSLG